MPRLLQNEGQRRLQTFPHQPDKINEHALPLRQHLLYFDDSQRVAGNRKFQRSRLDVLLQPKDPSFAKVS